MDAKSILNYKAISLLLTGGETGIRRDKCPKKHVAAVAELEGFAAYFITKHGGTLTADESKSKK